MGVLVRIHMRYGDTGLLQPLNLRNGFPFDVGAVNPAKIQVANKLPECCAKPWLGAATDGGIEQRGNGRRIRDRGSIHQDNMTADAESFLLPGNFNRFVKTSGCSHQRCRRQCAQLMQISHGTVDAVGESKVVSIHDESAHWHESIKCG